MSADGVFRKETVKTFLELRPWSVQARCDVSDRDVLIAWQLMFFVRKNHIDDRLRNAPPDYDASLLDRVAILLGFYADRVK